MGFLDFLLNDKFNYEKQIKELQKRYEKRLNSLINQALDASKLNGEFATKWKKVNLYMGIALVFFSSLTTVLTLSDQILFVFISSLLTTFLSTSNRSNS